MLCAHRERRTLDAVELPKTDVAVPEGRRELNPSKTRGQNLQEFLLYFGAKEMISRRAAETQRMKNLL